MRVIAAVARPMLASMFVAGGLDAARSPGPRTQAAEKLGLPQPALMVRLSGATMVAGGAALALGYKPRRAALLLAGTLLPTTYAGHAFWESEDPAARMQHQIHFMKNVSMLGGLLLVAGDSPHKAAPRSARKAAKHVAAAAAAAADQTRKAERGVSSTAESKAAKTVARAQKRAAKVEAKAAKAAKVQAKDRKRTERTASRAERAASQVSKVETKAGKQAAKYAKRARKQAVAVRDDFAAREKAAA